jgi:hypothetical protein
MPLAPATTPRPGGPNGDDGAGNRPTPVDSVGRARRLPSTRTGCTVVLPGADADVPACAAAHVNGMRPCGRELASACPAWAEPARRACDALRGDGATSIGRCDRTTTASRGTPAMGALRADARTRAPWGLAAAAAAACSTDAAPLPMVAGPVAAGVTGAGLAGAWSASESASTTSGCLPPDEGKGWTGVPGPPPLPELPDVEPPPFVDGTGPRPGFCRGGSRGAGVLPPEWELGAGS